MALKALLAIHKQDAYADIVISQIAKQFEISARDYALANELVRGVLRWQKRFDWIIDNIYAHKSQTMPFIVRIAVRMALYQLMFLDRIPEFAVLNESVEIVKKNIGKRKEKTTETAKGYGIIFR